MTERTKILLVEDDSVRAGSIMQTLTQYPRLQCTIDTRTAQQTAGASADWSEYDAAIVDVEHDKTAALAAVWKLRHAEEKLPIVLLAPSANYQMPIEIVELGIGPLVCGEAGDYPDLPSTLLALTDRNARGGNNAMVADSDLRVRHQELRDITDSLARQSVHLIRLRNELAAEKGKVEMVINNMTDGMAFFGVEGELELCNPVAERFFPHLLGKPPYPLEQFSHDIEKLKVARTSAPGGRALGVTEIEKEDNTLLVRHTTIDISEDEKGGSLFLFTDVTRDRKYEELKNDFTSMISHELRTPLTSIRAAVDNFLRGNLGDVNETQTKFLELISRNVDRQQGLIDNLLDLAKFEAGQMEVRRENSDIRLVLGFTVEQYSLAFSDKGVSLTYAAPPIEEAPPILLDTSMVIQAMENLLNNALKFTEKGGAVTVTLLYETEEAQGTMVVSVADTGVGIAEEKRERIFQKYSQADTGSRRRYTGTGLGLAIVKEIAEAHGGDISVTSSLGEGSCFTLRIPIEERGTV